MSIQEQQKKIASRYAQASASRPRTRTTKACDRCRFKKSKCDGGRPCSRCIRFDNPCLYGEPNAKARGKHHMSEILDVMAIGLRRLYSSCINNEGFPGVLSEQHIREMKEMDVQIPPTHAILEALGLIKAERIEKGDDEEQSEVKHNESYWHQLQPDRPLICHSPGNEARSVCSSHSTSPAHQSDDYMKGEDTESLPTSATTLSSMTPVGQPQNQSIFMTRPALPHESEMEQYVRIMQNKYYVPPSSTSMLSTTFADTTNLAAASFHESLYTTMIPTHQTDNSAFSPTYSKGRLAQFPRPSLQSDEPHGGPHGVC